MLAKADSYLVGQLGDARLNLVPALQIFGKGIAVAYRLGRGILSGRGNGGVVRSAGKVVELSAVFA